MYSVHHVCTVREIKEHSCKRLLALTSEIAEEFYVLCKVTRELLPKTFPYHFGSNLAPEGFHGRVA